jgi:hypothetical protein
MCDRQSGEGLWILLSVLVLPIERQIEVIGGLTDDEHEINDKMFVSNSLLFSDALYCYGYSWVDQDFDFLYDFEEHKPSRLQEAFIAAIAGTSTLDKYKSQFINSVEWAEVRRLGSLILEMSGLPPNPVEQPIDFNEYLEIVIDPEHGLIAINC